ncbi:hypothetical protein L7F22_068894 [Adiantum nelumboides]|nr:hypothetical protein [Adiantum nelumboides]
MSNMLLGPVLSVRSPKCSFGIKDLKMEDTSVARLKQNYAKEGMRKCVEGILLVQEPNHPLVLMLQIGNTLGKLPSQRLKPEIAGLKRKLTGKLTPASVSAPPDWKISGDEKNADLRAAPAVENADLMRLFWLKNADLRDEKNVDMMIEKYCCGLPKGLRKYCTKTKVTTLTQLIEVANTGNGLLKGEDCEFNTGIKDGFAKKNSAKKYILNEVPRATQEPSKAWKGKATAEPANKWKKPFPPRKSEEQRQVLKTENKCFICEQTGHYANNCPQKKRPADSEDEEDRKGKRPMAGLVPDMVGDKPNSDASELCRAWGKVRDQTVLIFFDPGAKANFISPELASRLGIRSEEMGYTAEAGLACPGHTEAVTPIIGKLRLQIQSYVDAEEFYIMPLDGCDVLLGIPWLFRVQGILDVYNKKITVQSRGKTLILDVKLKGESVPTVSASAISSVMKKHLSAYLVFAR